MHLDVADEASWAAVVDGIERSHGRLDILVNNAGIGDVQPGSTDRTALVEATPMGRLGAPTDVAEAIAFLAGPHASFISGVELSVDGGYLAR